MFCKESVFAKMGKLEGYTANFNNCDRGIVWAFDIAQALFFWVFSLVNSDCMKHHRMKV